MSLDGAVVGQTDVDAVTVHSKTSHSSKKNVREAMDVGKTNCAKKKAAFTNQPIELSLSLDSEPSTRKVRLLYFIFTRQKSALRARPRCARMESGIPGNSYGPNQSVPHLGPGLEGL